MNGKWKFQILISIVRGNKTFKDIARDVQDISDRMLSKELKELEYHRLVECKFYNSFPPIIEYVPTPHTYTLSKVIKKLKEWGYIHREEVLRK